MGRTICETVSVTGLSKGEGTGGVYTSTPTSALRMSFFEVSIGAVEHLSADGVVHRGFEGGNLVLVISHKSDLAELLMPDGFQPDPARRHLHFIDADIEAVRGDDEALRTIPPQFENRHDEITISEFVSEFALSNAPRCAPLLHREQSFVQIATLSHEAKFGFPTLSPCHSPLRCLVQ